MRPAHLIAAIASATLVAAGGVERAAAQSTPSFFPERYVACREPRARREPVRPAPLTPSAWTSLARRSAPPPLPIAPLTVIDVAVAEPVPTRPADPLQRAPEPAATIASAPQDWRCVGFTRGKAGILRVLRAPPLARFADHPDADDWRLDNARAASAAGFAEALPELRKILARPVPRTDGPELFDALDAKLNAARALSDLGDRGSARPFADHLAAREDESYSLIWLAGWAALEGLDRDAAETYAADVVRRVAEGRKTGDPKAADDDTLLRAALPALRTPDPARLALVRRLPRSEDRCDVLAARLRLGDVALRDVLRPELGEDLRTQRGAVCYGDVMPDLFPGAGPEEVDVLLHRHRMGAILELVERGHARKPGDAAWQSALSKLRTTLTSRSADPDVAAGPTDRRYQPVKRAQHLVALAELGDAKARADVARLVADDADDGVAPWVATSLVLRFGWPDAADLAAKRLAWARRGFTRRYDTDLEPVRGFASVIDHTLVVDALAARKDPRFALGLLDRERSVREATAVHFARLALPATCDVVTAAAAGAEERAVQDAFWVLSMLGDRCREQAHRAATDAAAPEHVRGMALELLAMMRDPRAKPLVRPRAGKDDIRPARERARIIFESPD